MIDYQEVVQLLGKKVDDISVKEFLSKQLTEEPQITTVGGHRYWLRKQGIRLSLHPHTSVITNVFLYCRVPDSWGSWHRGMSLFSGSLPHGVILEDSSNAVRAKLDREPERSYSGERLGQERLGRNSEESELQALVSWRKTGKVPQGFEYIFEDEPHDWFADVYEIGAYEIHYWFLISDGQLIGISVNFSEKVRQAWTLAVWRGDEVYICLQEPSNRSKINDSTKRQVVDICQSDGGTRTGTLVLYFDTDNHLLGMDLQGATDALQPSFIEYVTKSKSGD